MTENSPRLASIDGYRGLVMALMLAEALHLPAVAKAVPESQVWRFLAYHQSHVAWEGCSLHDLIQPSFSFLVGTSLAFSLAARAAAGQSRGRMLLSALRRAAVLVLLGVFLRSVGRPQTNWTFEDTLTQIGLGYPLLVLTALGPPRLRWVALGLILVGYWLVFAVAPSYQPGVWPADVGVPKGWPHHPTGFAAHWDKNRNPAWAFDLWFLNRFPRPAPFEFNPGGYATASFVPTLGTMILGLIAGDVLRGGRSVRDKIFLLGVAGALCLNAGYGLGQLGVCPVVKRIWTPTWVLFSGGWCFLFLAGFLAVTDAGGYRRWAFPLVVVGANPIAAYLMDHLFGGFIRDALRRHLGADTFAVFGPEYEPLVLGAGVVAVIWLLLFWLYRRKLFLKV